MIKFENVNVTMQGKRILSDINLEIQDGEFVLICGESGCGKTTMTKLINGLIPHFVRDVSVDGTITVCGKNVAEMPMYEIAELVGSVFQNPKTQFFYTNSNAEMAFGLENRGVEPEYIRKRIKNTINELDIEKLEDRDVFSMSGGEKQLLAFASVYVMNPQIYVLDEPSANLDIAAMEKLSERMKVIKEKGHTVVVAEHRLAWIQKFADRIIYMKEGRIEQEFTSDEFKALSDLKRKQMGLRSIVPAQIQIPEITGNSEDAVLQIYNLSCKRKKQMIFQNISLSARAGDIIGITGKNGAGKSTFCNCLCGLLKPKVGEILYQGKKLSEKARTKLFGMVMQEVNHQLFSDSVKNECLLANEEASEQEIRELLEKFDLEEYAEYHPMILSGGQRQRLAICQAVMGEKKLLIFDEPTSGLDFRHMCQVEKLMKQLSEEKYIIIVVTHDYEFLNRACKRYIRINS
ncbi:ABC transporter ATP-binding protein [Anaerobutyricum hallii]|jgi:energy-coupling factor transporter ATP-binding protein EcfA2|uniref:ABC transporter ATP-binding protein n=1 Tax=Anaerobutyricum hallii TaxID=39488 RepID=UPI00242D8DC3|nr:ABC transporter ATP-binding protein [Anaerobutyricum hallii]